MNDYSKFLNEYKRVKKGKSKQYNDFLNTRMDTQKRLENKYLEFMSNVSRFNISVSELGKLMEELDYIYETEIMSFFAEVIEVNELENHHYIVKVENSNDYDLSSSSTKYVSNLSNAEMIKNIIQISKVDKLVGDYVYVDNFVGTGETFTKIADRLREGSEIILVCYSILEETYLNLTSKGYEVFYSEFSNFIEDEKLKSISPDLYKLENNTRKSKWYMKTTVAEYGLISPNNNLNILYNNSCSEKWIPLLYRPNNKLSQKNYIYGNKEVTKSKLSNRQKYILKGTFVEGLSIKELSQKYTIPKDEITKTLNWFIKCSEEQKIFFMSDIPR